MIACYREVRGTEMQYKKIKQQEGLQSHGIDATINSSQALLNSYILPACGDFGS